METINEAKKGLIQSKIDSLLNDFKAKGENPDLFNKLEMLIKEFRVLQDEVLRRNNYFNELKNNENFNKVINDLNKLNKLISNTIDIDKLEEDRQKLIIHNYKAAFRLIFKLKKDKFIANQNCLIELKEKFKKFISSKKIEELEKNCTQIQEDYLNGFTNDPLDTCRRQILYFTRMTKNEYYQGEILDSQKAVQYVAHPPNFEFDVRYSIEYPVNNFYALSCRFFANSCYPKFIKNEQLSKFEEYLNEYNKLLDELKELIYKIPNYKEVHVFDKLLYTYKKEYAEIVLNQLKDYVELLPDEKSVKSSETSLDRVREFTAKVIRRRVDANIKQHSGFHESSEIQQPEEAAEENTARFTEDEQSMLNEIKDWIKMNPEKDFVLNTFAKDKSRVTGTTSNTLTKIYKKYKIKKMQGKTNFKQLCEALLSKSS
jgi:hypothetical protein